MKRSELKEIIKECVIELNESFADEQKVIDALDSLLKKGWEKAESVFTGWKSGDRNLSHNNQYRKAIAAKNYKKAAQLIKNFWL